VSPINCKCKSASFNWFGNHDFAIQKSRFEIAGELNSFHRNFYKQYDEGNFKYIFSGMEVRLLKLFSIHFQPLFHFKFIEFGHTHLFAPAG